MRLRNPIAASLTLVAVLACGDALARTWTDTTGKYKIEGEFIKLTDGQVDVRRDDGKLVRIPLEKLSEADQQYARKAAKPADESPFSVTGDETQASAKPKAESAGSDIQTVFAEGVGSTKEEALKDAFRAAVRQVVGEVVDGETLVKNEELVKDQVLTYSDGFIPEHKVTSEKRDNGLFRVSIRAKVQRRSVIMKLKAANITLKNLDGQSLYGSIVTQIGAEKDASALVAKAFDGFPDHYLEAHLVNEPKVLEKTDSQATLLATVQFVPNLEAYKTFATRLCQTLDGVAKQKGEFSTVLRTRSFVKGTNFFDSYPTMDIEAIGQWMPKLVKKKDQYSSPEWDSDSFALAVATLTSKDCSRMEWSYFVLDPAVGRILMEAAKRKGTCKLSFLDTNGQSVAVDRFDIPVDSIPDPENERAHFQNEWRCILTKVIGADGKWRPEDLSRRGQGSSRWKPWLAFVAPVAFGDKWLMKYVPQFAVSRKIKLSHDEVKNVAKVKCEMSFGAANQKGEE